MPSSRVGFTPATAYIIATIFSFPALSYSVRNSKTPFLSALGFPSKPRCDVFVTLPFASYSRRSSAMPSSCVGLTPATAYIIATIFFFPALSYSIRNSKTPFLSAFGFPSKPKNDTFDILPFASYSRRISTMPSSRVGTAYIRVSFFFFPSLSYSLRTSKTPSLSALGLPSTPKYDSRVTLPSASYSQRVSATPELQMSNATKNATTMLIFAIETFITPPFLSRHNHPCGTGWPASFPSGLRPGRHRKRRETKTSSDASNEAPERARNDTSKEAKLHGLAVSSSRVIPMKFLRLPFDASHVRGGGLGETALPRGNSVLPRRFELLLLALA